MKPYLLSPATRTRERAMAPSPMSMVSQGCARAQAVSVQRSAGHGWRIRRMQKERACALRGLAQEQLGGALHSGPASTDAGHSSESPTSVRPRAGNACCARGEPRHTPSRHVSEWCAHLSSGTRPSDEQTFQKEASTFQYQKNASVLRLVQLQP